MAFTLKQQRTLALVPKITGGLSFCFSFMIVESVLRNRQRRKLCYHRLLCAIAISDMSASLWMFLSTWPIPADSGVVWAVGTEATCRAQGFFLQVGVSAPFYNASLGLYYWLVIVRGWKEEDLRRIEPLLHGCPLLWAAVTGIIGMTLDLYANANLWCWAGASYNVFRWTAYYGPLWCMILVATACCLSIYCHVRRFTIVAHVQEQQKMASTMAAARRSSMTRRAGSHGGGSMRSMQARRDEAHRGPRPSSDKLYHQQIQRQLKELDISGDILEDRQNEVCEHHCTDEASSSPDQYQNATNDMAQKHQQHRDEEDDHGSGAEEGLYDDDDYLYHDTQDFNAEADLSAALSLETVVERRIVMPGTFQSGLRRSRYVYRQSRRLREIASQCFWYAAAFYINFAALSVTRLIQIFDPDRVYYPLVLAAAITVPMQGLPNFLVYLRPIIRQKIQERRRERRGDAGTRPWWYLLAQSLSQKQNENGVDGHPQEQRLEENGRTTSWAVVHSNPTMVNDTPYLPTTTAAKGAGAAESSGQAAGETVLVVVDTPEGRKWRIESPNPD